MRVVPDYQISPRINRFAPEFLLESSRIFLVLVPRMNGYHKNIRFLLCSLDIYLKLVEIVFVHKENSGLVLGCLPARAAKRGICQKPDARALDIFDHWLSRLRDILPAACVCNIGCWKP